MLRGVDLIDITSLVGWEIFDIFYIFMLLEQYCFLRRRGGGLNIDRCLIKTSDCDMLDDAKVQLFIVLLN